MALGRGGVRIPIITEFDGAGIDRFANKMSGLGKSLTRNVTLPIVALGAASVKAFADFEDKLTQSFAIMGDLSEDMKDQMSQAARDVATNLGISHADAAESFFFLASAGLDATQSIAALPQVAAFAKAGMFDMATATDLATDAQSALGLTVDDAQQNLKNLTRVTDVFSQANALANTSVEQVAIAITTKAGVALRNVNKDIEEGVAVLAVFADAGVKGEEAGTLLARTIEGLSTQARTNAKDFKRLNVQVFDNSGAMRPFADIIGDVETALEGMTVEQRDAAIAQLGFTKLAKQGVLQLLGSSDALRTFEADLRSAGGATQEMADKQLESFTQQLAILKAEFVDLAIDIGPIIIDDFLKPVMALFKGLQERLASLTDEQRKVGIRFLALVAVLGPALILVASLARAVLTLSKVFAILNMAIFKIPLAIILLIGSFRLASSEQSKLAKETRSTWQFIFQVTKEGVVGVIELVDQQINQFKTLAATGDFAQRKLNNAFRIIGGLPAIALPSFKEFLQQNVEISNIAGRVNANFTKLGDDMNETFKSISTNLDDLDAMSKQAEDGVSDLEQMLKDLEKEQNETGKGAEKLTDRIKSLRDAMVEIKTRAVDALKSSLDEAQRKLDDTRKRFNEFKDAIAGTIRGILDFGKASERENFLSGLTEQAANATLFADKVKALIELGLSEQGIREVLSAGFEAGSKIADELIAGGATVVQQVNVLLDSVKSVAEQVGERGAQEFFAAGLTQGEALVNGILTALREAQSQLVAAQRAATGGGDVPQFGARATGLLDDIAGIKGAKKRAAAEAAFAKSLSKSGRGITIQNAANIRSQFKLAKGGLVTRGPINALIGEAGPEAVIPLSGPNAKGMGNTFNVTVNAGLGTDGANVGRQIVEAIKRFERTSGPVFAGA